ncbi:MAG TPA: hypothetical protein VLZ30_09180 [Verrucomicrobiae bacterium]|nr:hypothetical protein [Verrucomicrobiae bacterium]
MEDKPDWRLTNQEKYLKGVTLYHRAYRPYAKNPKWDHDHCAFCWEKFMVEDHPDTVHQGYATADDYHWVCETCFEDFKVLFDWKVIDEIK